MSTSNHDPPPVKTGKEVEPRLGAATWEGRKALLAEVLEVYPVKSLYRFLLLHLLAPEKAKSHAEAAVSEKNRDEYPRGYDLAIALDRIEQNKRPRFNWGNRKSDWDITITLLLLEPGSFVVEDLLDENSRQYFTVPLLLKLYPELKQRVLFHLAQAKSGSWEHLLELQGMGHIGHEDLNYVYENLRAEGKSRLTQLKPDHIGSLARLTGNTELLALYRSKTPLYERFLQGDVTSDELTKLHADLQKDRNCHECNPREFFRACGQVVQVNPEAVTKLIELGKKLLASVERLQTQRQEVLEALVGLHGKVEDEVLVGVVENFLYVLYKTSSLEINLLPLTASQLHLLWDAARRTAMHWSWRRVWPETAEQKKQFQKWVAQQSPIKEHDGEWIVPCVSEQLIHLEELQRATPPFQVLLGLTHLSHPEVQAWLPAQLDKPAELQTCGDTKLLDLLRRFPSLLISVSTAVKTRNKKPGKRLTDLINKLESESAAKRPASKVRGAKKPRAKRK